MRLASKRKLDLWLGGLGLFLLKPLVTLMGRLLRRDHQLIPRGPIFFIKMQGGGSLVLAMPALLGMKTRHPHLPLILICTGQVAVFAKQLHVFDEIRVIKDNNFLQIILSGLRRLMGSWRADTFIDLEVYSRLTAIFTVLSLARNRLGFFLESTYWRENIYTHLVFFSRHTGVFHFYEKMARLCGADPASMEECSDYLIQQFQLVQSHKRVLCIGVGCSELGRERMLSPAQWLGIIKRDFPLLGVDEIVFLGGEADSDFAQKLESVLDFPSQNLCGKLTMNESLQVLFAAKAYWGIDSGLLHFARLFRVPSRSFWGPTDPKTRLKPISEYSEEILYKQIACSPCVHAADIPPCRGDNRCIQGLFNEPSSHFQPFVPVLGPSGQRKIESGGLICEKRADR